MEPRLVVVPSLQVDNTDVAPPYGLSKCDGMRLDSLNPPASSPTTCIPDGGTIPPSLGVVKLKRPLLQKIFNSGFLSKKVAYCGHRQTVKCFFSRRTAAKSSELPVPTRVEDCRRACDPTADGRLVQRPEQTAPVSYVGSGSLAARPITPNCMNDTYRLRTWQTRE